MSSIYALSPIRRRIGFAKWLSMMVPLMSVSMAHAAEPGTVANPVTIANPEQSVPVNSPDPSRQAFSATFAQSSTTALNASFGTVPSGKRLVIENESMACYVSSGASILYAYIITSLGRTYLLLQKVGFDPPLGLDYYAGTFTSTIYADPKGLGTGDITFVLQASPGTAAVHCDGAIIGHNVVAPLP